MIETNNEAGAPGATVAAWFDAWLWFPLILTISTFLPLLFPTGRLPSLSTDLVAVTHRTMQPAAVSLWLREGEPSRG